LDQETERQVLHNLIRRGVTTVVITHRMSVLNLCSGAYRVQDGCVRPLELSELEQLAAL
jgi:ABC-type bacteriocin/lantibiotic exporter with double-glycine peptidase domain